ncbi:MAG: hypothetical protein JWM88_913 [Verrucomicrobia bacterium]|nr:hypothetical protein [Verrucomicrobiota bacterium]
MDFPVNFPFRFFFLFLAAGALARAADLPTGADTLLTRPAQNPAWADLFARLAPDRNRQSKFEERRTFPFRRTPVILKGEIRIVPERGLSLRYLEPEQRILIVDSQGLLMRDDTGRERAAPSDSRAQAVTSALVSVLRFDLAALEKSFAVHGRREGDAWTLAFVPLEPALGELVGVLAVSGAQGRIDRIEMVKSANQRIEILISGTQENVIFPGDVLHRFFR